MSLIYEAVLCLDLVFKTGTSALRIYIFKIIIICSIFFLFNHRRKKQKNKNKKNKKQNKKQNKNQQHETNKEIKLRLNVSRSCRPKQPRYQQSGKLFTLSGVPLHCEK